LLRFANRALADPVSRLARDPLRKLAPGDRLVGAARLVERHGIRPEGLSWGIAAALAYENPDDTHAMELQARLAREGLTGILQSLCAIQEDEPGRPGAQPLSVIAGRTTVAKKALIK
jgi:mannitol-1-phosphate 5-dehydrogenase